MGLTDFFKSKSDEASTNEPKDATDLLKEDHDKVRALFREMRAAGERATREKRRLFDEIDRELTIHATIEEEIFYPAVRKSRGEDASRLVAEATEEHAIVKRLLGEIRSLDGGDRETFDAKLKVLMEGVEHHADEEESDMFPEAESALGDDRIRELGREMQDRKEKLMARRASAPARKASRSRKKSRR